MSALDHLNDSFHCYDSQLGRARRAAAATRRGGGATNAGVDFLSGAGLTYGGVGERQRTAASRQAEHLRGWVYAVIRTIGFRVAGQPLRLARLPGGTAKGAGHKDPQSGRAPVRTTKDFVPNHLKAIAPQLDLVLDHPFLDLMKRPNDLMVGWMLMFVTVACLELTGHAYWLLRGEDDEEQIWPLPPPWVRPLHEGRPYSAYEVTPYNSSKAYTYPGEAIVHFCYPDPMDPLGALSPTQTQAAAIVADEAIQTAQQRAFRNGIFPGLVLTVGRQQEVPGVQSRPRLTMEQRRDLVNLVKGLYAGVVRYDEPIILDALIESVTKLSHVPREMDFLNSGKQTKGRILQGYGVNAYIMGEIENANRAVAVVSEENFATNVLNPRMQLLSEVLTAFMLPRVDPDRSLVAYLEPARANDPEMTLRERDQLIKSGSLMRDELRAMHNIDPLPNGAGRTIILMPGQAIVPADQAFHDASAVSGRGGPPQPPKEDASPTAGSDSKPAAPPPAGNGKKPPQPPAPKPNAAAGAAWEDLPERIARDEQAFDEPPRPRPRAADANSDGE